MTFFGEGGQNIIRYKNVYYIANSCIIKNQTIQKPTVYKNGNVYKRKRMSELVGQFVHYCL